MFNLFAVSLNSLDLVFTQKTPIKIYYLHLSIISLTISVSALLGIEFKSNLAFVLNHSTNSLIEQSSSKSIPFSFAIEAALSYSISSSARVFYFEANNLATKVVLFSELS
jgi:hypothetical protein